MAQGARPIQGRAVLVIPGLEAPSIPGREVLPMMALEAQDIQAREALPTMGPEGRPMTARVAPVTQGREDLVTPAPEVREKIAPTFVASGKYTPTLRLHPPARIVATAWAKGSGVGGKISRTWIKAQPP